MGELLVDWLQALWMILVESGPYLLVGFVIAGILSVLVPATWIARRLGRDDVKSVATAAVIGVPVPLCSCSVIPTATQLRRSGASRGATTSFLISTPETGVDSIGATWALMDPLMTVVRPIAAFVTAFASGVAVNLFGRGPSGPLDAPAAAPSPGPPSGPAPADGGGCCAHGEPAPPPPADGGSSCHADTSTAGGGHGRAHGDDHDHDHGPGPEAPLHRRVLAYAFGTLLDDLAPWFLVGFALSGLIVVAVPDGFFAGTLFSGWAAMLAMLVAGTPLYVCATASTPIAAAMMAKGLAPGAALVFLLAGPATNVATMLVVRDLLGRRVLAIYLASIAVLSVALGTVVDRLYPAFGLDPTAMDVTPGAMEHGPVATASGLVLALLLARSAWRLRLDRRFGAWLRRTGAPIGLDPTAGPVRAVAALALLAGYASTAVTVVAPGEAVFVERFGRVVAQHAEPGALVHLPWPVDRPVRTAAATLRTERFGVASEPIPDDEVDVLAFKRLRAELARLEDEAEMMTGDETTLVAIEYAVQYRVTDPERWTYGFSAPDQLLRRLAQESVRRVVAGRTVDEVLVDPAGTFGRDTEVVLRERLEGAGLGVELAAVTFLSVHAPPAVHENYRAVASAMVDAETTQLVARRRAGELLSETRIEAAGALRDARDEEIRRVALAEGLADAREAMIRVDEATGGAVRRILMLESLARTFEGGSSNGTQPGSRARRVIALLSPHIRIPIFEAPQDSMLEELILQRSGRLDPLDDIPLEGRR